MKTSSILKLLSAVAFTVGLIPASSHAAPYASDSFDYALGENANTQNGGSGFGSAWTFSTTGTGASATIVAGLSLTGIQSSGNAMQISANPSGGSVSGYLNRQFGNTTPANSNLWGSFLIKQTAKTDGGWGTEGSISGTRFLKDGAFPDYYASPESSVNGWNANFVAKVGIYKNSGTAQTAEGPTLPLNQTFLAIYAFENIATPAFSTNTTTGTLWVLDQDDVTAINGDFTIANLDANHFLKTPVAAMVNPTFGTAQMLPNTPFGLYVQQGTVTMDEVRLGTTLADVAASSGSTPVNYDSWINNALYNTPTSLTAEEKLPNADPDHDSISNLMEFSLGGNPVVSSQDILPKETLDASSIILTFKRSDDSEASTTLQVQISETLSDWTTIPPITIGAGNTSGVAIIENESGDDDVTVSIPRDGSARKFVRLEAINQ